MRLHAVRRDGRAYLVAALCVPGAFGNSAKLFAVAYGIVRGAHMVLLLAACRDNPPMRQSVIGLAAGTALGVGLILAASFTDGTIPGSDLSPSRWRSTPRSRTSSGPRAGRWCRAISPSATGSSSSSRWATIVAIGVGAEAGVNAGVAVAAVLGMAVTAALWWLYFDIVALVAVRQAGGRARRDASATRSRVTPSPTALPDGRGDRA